MSEATQHAEEIEGEKPATRRKRKERAMTTADWEKVHNANVRAERHPDPQQTNILDAIDG